MRKYRIVTAAIVATVCATTELHAQFSFMFGEKDQAVMQTNVPANNSCAMQNCPPKWTSWGHYPVSWRRWPEDVSQYTTNPQLSPFVVPDRSGAPEVQVPDALNETLYSPRKRNEPVTGGPANEELPTAEPTTGDDPATADLPSFGPPDDLDPAADLLSDESDRSSESPVDLKPEPSAAPDTSDDDLFNDLDTGPAPDDDGGLDDLLNGTDALDGFGNRQPRRYQRRNARDSDPNRFSDFRPYREPIGRVERTSSARSDSESDNELNPLRRKQLSNEPKSVAYAVHYDRPQGREEYRDGPREYEDVRFEPMDHQIDTQQIDFVEYERRRNLYKYGDSRDFDRSDEYRYMHDQTRNGERRPIDDGGRYRDGGHGYDDYAPKRPQAEPRSRSANPLRR